MYTDCERLHGSDGFCSVYVSGVLDRSKPVIWPSLKPRVLFRPLWILQPVLLFFPPGACESNGPTTSVNTQRTTARVIVYLPDSYSGCHSNAVRMPTVIAMIVSLNFKTIEHAKARVVVAIFYYYIYVYIIYIHIYNICINFIASYIIYRVMYVYLIILRNYDDCKR